MSDQVANTVTEADEADALRIVRSQIASILYQILMQRVKQLQEEEEERACPQLHFQQFKHLSVRRIRVGRTFEGDLVGSIDNFPDDEVFD